MPTNQQIIEKAAMTLASLSAGGRMNVEQADTFLRMVQNQPTIMKDARFIPMSSDRRKIEKIGFGNRILRAGTEGTALADSQLAVPTTGTVDLEAKEVIAEVNITYDTLENNIEGNNLQDTIMQMIAERASLDLEELAVNGDTASGDPYLALIDGLCKQAGTGHVVDFADAAMDKSAFKKGIKAVPAKYLRNPAEWRFYASQNAELDWKDLIAARQTQLGDQAIEGRLATAYGIPVKGIAMLQPYVSNTKTVSDMLVTHPKNIVIGMSRNISVEVDKDIRARKFIIVLTAKIDVVFEEVDATALVKKVGELA